MLGQARGVYKILKHFFGCFTPEERISACLPRALRQVLISDRIWGYEANTLFDLNIIALCCLSCHRKAPWLSYFKPSVPLVKIYLKNLKKKGLAPTSPLHPQANNLLTCSLLQHKAESLFNTNLPIMDLTWYVNRKSLFTCCPHFVHW